MKKASIFLVMSLVILFCSCGQAGTWEDDPGNWKRAFRSQKPDDVNIVHSLYWRSPHFAYEFQYFFEIESNEKLLDQLFTENDLKKIEGQEARAAMKDFFGEKPDWFAPGWASKYDIYVFANEPGKNFRVFIKKESGDIFLTDYQV